MAERTVDVIAHKVYKLCPLCLVDLVYNEHVIYPRGFYAHDCPKCGGRALLSEKYPLIRCPKEIPHG